MNFCVHIIVYLPSFLTPVFFINELIIGPANSSGAFVNVDKLAKSNSGPNIYPSNFIIL